jgi:hypothetical protein
MVMARYYTRFVYPTGIDSRPYRTIRCRDANGSRSATAMTSAHPYPETGLGPATGPADQVPERAIDKGPEGSSP